MINPIKLLTTIRVTDINGKNKYNINSQGYRCPEFETINWEESILLFGCSQTFGIGCPDSDTVATQLQLMRNRPVITLAQGATGYAFNWINSTILKGCGVKPYAAVYMWPEHSRQVVFNNSNYFDQQNIGHWNITPDSDRTDLGVALTMNENHGTAMAYYYSTNLEVLWDCPTLQYSWAPPFPESGIRKMDHPMDKAPWDPMHPGIETNKIRANRISQDLLNLGK